METSDVHNQAGTVAFGATSAGRRHLLSNGYQPIPICGKGPRWPWRSSPITAELLDAIEADPQYSDHRNTGLVTGTLVAVDIDLLDPMHAQSTAETIFRSLGYSDTYRVGSKGAAYLYFNPDPAKKITIAGKPPGEGVVKILVEILGDGQQVAAYGIHPTTRRPYQWPNDFDGGHPLERPLVNLPHVSKEMLDAASVDIVRNLSEMGYRDVDARGFRNGPAKCSKRIGEPVPLAWVIAALKSIPPTVKREQWLRVLWAVKSASIIPDLDDCGRIELLDRWSSGDLQEHLYV